MKISFTTGLNLLVSLLLEGCKNSASTENESAENETASASSVEEGSSETQAQTSEGEHNHSHDDETEQIYKGYFEDSQVTDRSLSDWEGDWQSVYPYLQDGTLDEVFAYKA